MNDKKESKPDEYYRNILEDNPYVKVPQPENVRKVVDRYEHAKKDEACWQIKWDMIHCVLQSDCVQVRLVKFFFILKTFLRSKDAARAIASRIERQTRMCTACARR